MKEWNDNCLELYDKIRQVPDNAKKTISSVKARVCGSNLEPSVGTRISIKFSADN